MTDIVKAALEKKICHILFLSLFCMKTTTDGETENLTLRASFKCHYDLLFDFPFSIYFGVCDFEVSHVCSHSCNVCPPAHL